MHCSVTVGTTVSVSCDPESNGTHLIVQCTTSTGEAFTSVQCSIDGSAVPCECVMRANVSYNPVLSIIIVCMYNVIHVINEEESDLHGPSLTSICIWVSFEVLSQDPPFGFCHGFGFAGQDQL